MWLVRLVSILAMVIAPLAAEAQQAARVYRVGVLLTLAPPLPSDPMTTPILFAMAMRELGYIEGQNVIIERRYGEGRLDRLPGLARELVDLRVDVIVAIASAAVRAAMSVTTTIPIVMFVNVDPVAVGLVASLSRPGGNVTGVLIAPDGTLAGKKLELLREVVPRASRIAFLAPSDSGVRPQIQEVQNAAVPLGVNLSVVEVQGGEYERAFAAVSRGQAGALFVAAHPFFIGIASSSSSLPPSTACQRCTSGPNTSRRAA